MSSPTFTRHDVQDMLDEAQLNAGFMFFNKSFLCDQLQRLFWESLMECNSQHVDPINVLLQSLGTERRILDAYNKHRLGKAYAIPNGPTIEYDEKDNIPEELEWFPLRAEVAKHGALYVLPPIYQVRSTLEDNQEYTAKPIETKRESAASPKTTNNRKAGARQKAKPKKTRNGKLSANGKKSTGFGSASYDKLRDAPSAWLGLPNGNLTLAEMTAFIPHAIKSYDIMDRFLYNGALSGTFADMINQYRHMPYGRIENNSIYRMMKGPMNHRAKHDPTYENWTVAKHAAIQKPIGFDPTSVSVAGFSTPVNFNSRQSAAATTQSPPSIPFRDMATGVRTMPSGYDALDLTRCVEHCIKFNDGSWRYPQDFEQLVASLGGPAIVYPEHQDDAAILRHVPEKKRMNARRAGARQRDNHGYLLKQEKGFVVDSDEEEALDEGSEGSEESEESVADLDSDEVNDDEPVRTTKKGAKRKSAFEDDVSDVDDFTQQIGAPSKRRRTTSSDEDYEQTPTRRISKRGKKAPPKTRARKKPLFEDMDSESDGDTFAGPKRKNKKVVVATRSSTRSRGFIGSYSVEKGPYIEEEEGEEEDD
jgi:hypothetical protein